MAEDRMVVDVDELKPETKEAESSKKSLKRKRLSVASVVQSLTPEERESRIGVLREELNGLFKYYKEVLEQKTSLGLGIEGDCGCSRNYLVACLLEETNLALSKLVDEIYMKLKARERNDDIAVASVKSSVLLIGQRSFYGVPNANADVLEDDTESCLWCWETRDLKLMPKPIRALLKIRRICRKKIHERITAVSGMISALHKSDDHPNCRQELMRASEKLGRVLSEVDIRLLQEKMLEKNSCNMVEEDAKREEKLLLKQLERSKREEERERKRMDKELQKEKMQSEKELKRLQEEAEKEERRHEKEEIEIRKQQRRQQEEAQKDQRRREKEEAQLRKQMGLQKQAFIMECFLKKRKNNSTNTNEKSLKKETSSATPSNKRERMPESVTLPMDHALSQTDEISINGMWKSHLKSWRQLGESMRSNGSQCWGIRMKPKTELVKELKLISRALAHDDDLSMDKLVDEWSDADIDGRPVHANSSNSLPTHHKHDKRKQLLQFDKSHRPAYYGIWPKKSLVVGARCPFEKDPDLDYEVDSDEEWEEEEPGESLSDCDKDDEEESLDDGYLKADEEDESGDDFFVPDGYLSENEGVQIDRKESDHLVEDATSSPGDSHVDSEEFCVLLRQQKYLHNMTEHALRKNQPLIILNLMHEKASLLLAEDLVGTLKVEKQCLQALTMCAIPGGPAIEISVDTNDREENQDDCSLSNKDNTVPVALANALLESDIPQVVSVIQSCSHSMSKVVELLQQKYPTIPKSQLRTKVREVSDFTDNRWQVKKDILDKLGLSSVSPRKRSTRKSIATFFSKRCLPPPAGKGIIGSNEVSPQSSQKSSSSTSVQMQRLQDRACN